VTQHIKQEVDKAVALSEKDQQRLFDAVGNWNRAIEHVRTGQIESGLKTAKEAATACESLLGAESYLRTALVELQAEALVNTGRGADAGPAVEQLRTIRAKQYGPEHPFQASVSDLAGRAALAKGQWKEAAEEFNRSLKLRDKVLGAKHASNVTPRLGLIRVAVGQGQTEAATKLLAAFEEDWKQLVQTSPPVRVEYLSVAVQCHRAANRLFEAQGNQENLVAVLMNALPRTHPQLQQEVLLLRALLAEQGKWQLVRRLEEFWALPPLAAKMP
jgi:hypothetical protein